MFAAKTLTAWMEAFEAVFHSPDYVGESLRDIPISTDYPMKEVDYPGLWVNYSMQGDLKTVGIGHEEFYPDANGDLTKVFRWHFGGVVEVTVAALSNLERALLLDELTRTIAVGRIDENQEGELRRKIERHDLIGQIVTWDSFGVGAFAESQGTPWGTDDVIYEATLTITTSGEVIVDPATGALVRLSAVLSEVAIEGEVVLPVSGTDGWL